MASAVSKREVDKADVVPEIAGEDGLGRRVARAAARFVRLPGGLALAISFTVKRFLAGGTRRGRLGDALGIPSTQHPPIGTVMVHGASVGATAAIRAVSRCSPHCSRWRDGPVSARMVFPSVPSRMGLHLPWMMTAIPLEETGRGWRRRQQQAVTAETTDDAVVTPRSHSSASFRPGRSDRVLD